MKILLLITVLTTSLLGNYSQLLFNGNCITCHQTNNLNKSAPTIMEIKSSYINAFPKKNDFVSYMVTWVLNPQEKTSVMSDAIKKYDVMPELAFDKQTLEEIATYIYENDFKN